MSMTTFNGKQDECLDNLDPIYYHIPPQLSKLPTPVLTILDLPVA